MSFKREGDDKNQMGILRQRRIKDLLAVDIPEDEAFLTSNGRLACIVCYHRPVFDTIEMLLVHRQGKKHAAGVAYKNQEKKELQQLIIKRKHEQFMRDGTVTNIEQGSQSSDSKKLCLGQAYDSRCKKKKNPNVKINLNCQQETCTTSTGSTLVSELPRNRHSNYSNAVGKGVSFIQSAETSKTLPKNKVDDRRNLDKESAFTTMLEKQRNGPVVHSRQLKNIFEKPLDGPIRVTPYQSKNIKTTHYHTSPGVYRPPDQRERCVRESNNTVQENIALNSRTQPAVIYPTKIRPKTTGKCVSKDVKISKPLSNEVHLKNEKAEKYLHYRGAGWKKDLFGKWVKDEDAEFDSDEEPPDLP